MTVSDKAVEAADRVLNTLYRRSKNGGGYQFGPGDLRRVIEAAVSVLPKPRTEKTSPRVAKIAAKGLADPASLTMDEIKAVCGSATTQTTGDE